MLVLAIGDCHIPERATDIPAKFKKLLAPRGKIQQVLCVGNVTRSPSNFQFLKTLSPDLQLVKGDYDKDLSLPLSLVFTYDNLKVGLINGFEVVPKSDPLSLLTQARMMDVDVLIYGSTHKVEAYTLDGKFFINPGSASGAFNSDAMDAEDLEIIESVLKEPEEEKAESAAGEPADAPKADGTARDGSAVAANTSDATDEDTKAGKRADTKADSASEEAADAKKEEKDGKKDGKNDGKKDGKKDGKNDDKKDGKKDGKNDDKSSADTPAEPEADPVEGKEAVKEATKEDAKETGKDAAKEAAKESGKAADSSDSVAAAADPIADIPDDELDTTEIEPFLDPIPSFCLLDVQGSTCTLYLYTLIDGEVKVDKLTYVKEESG